MVLASNVGTVGIAIITGGLAGAFVTALFGPIVADRLARHETYRTWQRDLSNDVLTNAAKVWTKIKSDSPVPDQLVDELEVLAQRVDLIFISHKGAPKAAMGMWEAASAHPPNRSAFMAARTDFVNCASDEIRARWWWARRSRGTRQNEETAQAQTSPRDGSPEDSVPARPRT